jgi:hypothetical protein
MELPAVDLLKQLKEALMTKELFIKAHEELIEEAMELDPSLTEEQAYTLTAPGAYSRMTDKLADMADYLKDKADEERLFKKG